MLTNYTYLLSNQMGDYEDTFRGTTSIMFELGECSWG